MEVFVHNKMLINAIYDSSFYISYYDLVSSCNLDKFIATSWGKEIDWLNLSKKDMMNPLVNATIARLYISTMDSKAIPDTKEGRAELWERMYNTKDDKKGTAAYYLSKNLDMP